MVAARILPIDFLHFINGDQKGLAEGSGNPFFCILSHEKIGAEGEGRVMSPWTIVSGQGISSLA